MSPKKRYEVQAFTTCVSEVMNDANCNVVIDMGAGKGYLSRFLGFSLDFDVVAIDCSRTNTEGAQKQTNKISSTLSKIKKGKQEEGEVSVPEEKEHKIIHIESWIDASTDLSSLLQDKYHLNLYEGEDIQSADSGDHVTSVEPANGDRAPKKTKNVGIVGLHCCGDLTPTILRLFCNNPGIRSLMVVGCCYYAMSEERQEGEKACSCNKKREGEEERTDLRNYPMSAFLRSLDADPVISDGGLKVACDNGEAMDSETILILGTNCSMERLNLSAMYRMLLDKLCWSNQFDVGEEKEENPCGCQLTIHKVKVKANTTFYTYLHKALSRVRIRQETKDGVCPHTVYNRRTQQALALSEEELQEWFRTEVETHKPHIRLNLVLTLRTLVSSLLESLLIVDRFIFLKEREKEAGSQYLLRVEPLFDQTISPRNMAFLAIKQ
eukprot:TRINITY_DN7094_c0_g1_i1.p1 TRINITY_DN7094_c0_g1~~TRINITY_DN7094_c0_g1_i1.p1  ORF type:complete len:437 (+),score=90.21 TRINITY_DN7094_c0_g1_i1:385-1695(+)